MPTYPIVVESGPAQAALDALDAGQPVQLFAHNKNKIAIWLRNFCVGHLDSETSRHLINNVGFPIAHEVSGTLAFTDTPEGREPHVRIFTGFRG